MRRLLALVALLLASTAIAQWTREQVDGEQMCVRETGEQIKPPSDAPSWATFGCRTLNVVETWLGRSLPEARADVLIGPGAIPEPPDSMVWTTELQGDAAGTIVETSSGTRLVFSISSSDDHGNKAMVYQSFESGDIENLCTVPSTDEWTGHLETWTFFGCGLEDANGYIVQMGRPYSGSGTAQCKADESPYTWPWETFAGSAGLTGPFYYAVTYDTSAGIAKCFESSDGMSYQEVGSLDVELSYPVKATVYGTSHQAGESTQVTITGAVAAGTITVYTPSDPGEGGSPVCTGIPNQSWTQGVAINPIDMDDYCTDSQTLTYSASGLPGSSGLSLSSSTGVLSGTPNANDVAASPFNVTITATDTDENEGSDTFLASVAAVPGDIFLIPTSQSTVDCRSAQPLQGGGTALPGPGDVIVLDGTTRGRITIRDCTGSESSPIIVRNDASETGPLVLQKTGSSNSGFTFELRNNRYLEVDAEPWTGADEGGCGTIPETVIPYDPQICGIKVTLASGVTVPPSALVMINGTSEFVTVRNVETDGVDKDYTGNGLGIHAGDHFIGDGGPDGPFRDGIVIEHVHSHNHQNECNYMGPNWANVVNTNDRRMRNTVVRQSYIHDCDGRGLSLKTNTDPSAPGIAEYNHVVNVGTMGVGDTTPGHGHGLVVYDGSGIVRNNFFDGCGEHCVEFYILNTPPAEGVQIATAYNNIARNPGTSAVGLAGRCFDVGTSAPTGRAQYEIDISYNTCIDGERTDGFEANAYISQAGVFRDNLCARTSGTCTFDGPSNVVKTNNRSGSIAAQQFNCTTAEDATCWRLTASSPAVDAGSTEAPADDIDGDARDGSPDQGADEYVP